MDDRRPRHTESLEPPAIEAAFPLRGSRKSRHSLRLPTDLTRMHAPDDPTKTLSEPPPPSDHVARPTIPSAPPDIPDVLRSSGLTAKDATGDTSIDVEVTLDGILPVTVPPPPPKPVEKPVEATSTPSEGTMRVVRRRVHKVGHEDGSAYHIPSSIPPSPDENVRIPSQRSPNLSDFGFSNADAQKISSAPPTEPSPPIGETPPPALIPSVPVRLDSKSTPPTDNNLHTAALSQEATPANASVPPTVDLLSGSSHPPVMASQPPPSSVSVVPTPPPFVPAVRASYVPPLAEAAHSIDPTPVSGVAPSTQPAAFVSSMPPLPIAAAAAAIVASTEAAARNSVEFQEDESVEISMDDALSSQKSVDPSLAMLDELAELGHSIEPESLDADAVEHVDGMKGASMPPPPPTDASRKAARSGTASPSSTSRIAGGPTLVEGKSRRRKMWWEDLFNEDYFRTVEALTDEQKLAEIDWIEHALGVEPGAQILDVACGDGRHAIGLSQRRYGMTGIDLSMAMLARASESAQAAGVKATFVQGDMTTMDYAEGYDAAYCVGSSFGFFDDSRNAEVARRIHRALKQHGTFLLGMLNRDHVIQRQPGMSWFEGDGCVCMEESSFNFITSRLNVKRTMIYDDGRQREFEYSLRLYSLHEIGQILHDAGFRILEVSGNTRTPGAFFGPTSRELIILAQKRGSEVVDLQNDNDATRSQNV
jgi:SAM-dependent methyltransferase